MAILEASHFSHKIFNAPSSSSFPLYSPKALHLVPNSNSNSNTNNNYKRGLVQGFKAWKRFNCTASSSSQVSPEPDHTKEVEWWEKGGGPNMLDAHSLKELADIISAAGEKLVVVEYFAPWCGSCRALYPKLCKIAQQYTDVIFVKINFDGNSSLCTSLRIKELPYFQLYRGVGGDYLDAFTCSIATELCYGNVRILFWNIFEPFHEAVPFLELPEFQIDQNGTLAFGAPGMPFWVTNNYALKNLVVSIKWSVDSSTPWMQILNTLKDRIVNSSQGCCDLMWPLAHFLYSLRGVLESSSHVFVRQPSMLKGH